MAWMWKDPEAAKDIRKGRALGGFSSQEEAKRSAILSASGHLVNDAQQIPPLWRSLARVGWAVDVEMATLP